MFCYERLCRFACVQYASTRLIRACSDLLALTASLLLTLFAAPASALQGESSQDVQEPATRLWFAPGDEVELVDLLDACAAELGLPLDYERSKVQGKVTIRAGAGFEDQSIWALTNRLLLSNKLASIQASGDPSIGIVPLGEAAKLARIETNLTEAQAGFVKVLKNLHYAAPEKAAEVLSKVLSSEGSLVQALPQAVLIAGPKPQVIEALGVLDFLDSAMPPAVEAIPVRHTTPVAVTALLERVEKAIEQVSQHAPEGMALADPASGTILVVAPEPEILWWREQIERFDQAQPAVTRNYVPRRFSLEETAQLVEEVVRWPPEAAAAWRMVEDELTGTLIVTATPSQHADVEALLARLEASAPDVRIALRAYPVRHRDVDEVLGLLEHLLQGKPLPLAEPPPSAPSPINLAPEAPADVPAEPVLATPPSPAATGGRPVPQARDLSLAMDPGTNRILAVGPPRLLDELGRLIEELDTQEPQVLVETLIVTLSESQTRALAVELQKIGTSDGTLWRLASLFGLGSPDAADVVLPDAAGTGLETVILDPGSFSGVLRALETVNQGRAMNVPKVLVNNNQTATLDSVLQQPFATSNTSTNLATISFGGTLDAGTSVQVTPQITDGDQLLIEYQVSLSTFVGTSADPTLPPPRQENKLASQATVPDGYCVVVGGLEIETESDAESRIPFIGAIPILGNLFKSQNRATTKSRFYVFLRCSVLRDARYEDLRYLSAAPMACAGVDDGIPVVEPRIIR